MNPGETRLGNYTLIAKLGQGGMGAVYKARQEGIERLVALKVLPRHLARDQAFITRFLREARAAGRLSHPNIVAGIDAGFADGFYYFAMEYVEGTNLGERLAAEGRIPESEAVEYCRQIALALDHAHRSGVVHRDIKPENILIAGGGQAKLCDLGLAIAAGEDLRLTQTGIAIGTPYYISPEQTAGREADARSDVYSLGATLFHLVAGRPPHDGANALEIMHKHLAADVPPIRTVCPEASLALESVLLKMTARSPEAREQTAAEAAEDLARAASGVVTRLAPALRVGTRPLRLPTPLPHHRGARPGGKSDPAHPVPQRPRRRSGPIWIVATACAALAMGGYLLAHRGPAPAPPGSGTQAANPDPAGPGNRAGPEPSNASGPLRAAWTKVEIAGDGPGVRGHITTAMAYDSKRKRSVLFGGASTHPGLGYGDANDLWALDLAARSWTRLEPNRPKDPGVGKTLPPPVTEGLHLMYIEDRDVYQWNSAWIYDPNAGSWKMEPPIDGASLSYGWNRLSACAYDPDDRLFIWWKEATVLVDARTRRARSLRTGPKCLDYATGNLAYDPRHKVFVLFHPGGRNAKASETTWLFDPAADSWRAARPPESPPARWAHRLVSHDRLGVVVLIGGCTGYYKDWTGDLWVYEVDKDRWTELKPFAPLPPPGEKAAVYDASQNRIAVFVQGQVWTLQLERGD